MRTLPSSALSPPGDRHQTTEEDTAAAYRLGSDCNGEFVDVAVHQSVSQLPAHGQQDDCSPRPLQPPTQSARATVPVHFAQRRIIFAVCRSRTLFDSEATAPMRRTALAN